MRSISRGALVGLMMFSAGCSLQPSTGAKPTLVVNMTQSQHLVFAGRGAAAGPMFMSAMGASGIAIGLAIDVGIAKDIEKFGFGEDFDVQLLADAAARNALQQSRHVAQFLAGAPVPVFNIQKLGFFEAPAKQNVIFAHLKIQVTRGEWQIILRYPEDFPAQEADPQNVASLETLKTPQSPAQILLINAMAKVIDKATQQYASASKGRG